MTTSKDMTVQDVDDALWRGAVKQVEGMKRDQVPLVITWCGDECQIYDVRPLMDKRELIGKLMNRLVTTPGLDFVAQIGQGYALQITTPEAQRRYREAEARGLSIKDMPEHIEVVHCTIFDKTKPQCEAWTIQHIVNGHKLTRGERHLLKKSYGRMAAPIPQRQD